MRYSVAVKRKFRDEMPRDWAEQLAAREGVRLEGEAQFGRLIIEASEEAIAGARAAMGEKLHIEPLSFYETSDEPDKDVNDARPKKRASGLFGRKKSD